VKMDGYVIQKWNRCNSIAKTCKVKIEVSENGFRIYDINQLTLGSFRTVAEVYAFLCGYEHSKEVMMDREQSKNASN